MNYEDYNNFSKDLKVLETRESKFSNLNNKIIILLIYVTVIMAVWLMFEVVNKNYSLEKVSVCLAVLTILFSSITMLIMAFNYKDKDKNKAEIKRVLLYLALISTTNFEINNKNSSLEVKKMEALMKKEMGNILKK
jgi:hypothetical protein